MLNIVTCEVKVLPGVTGFYLFNGIGVLEEGNDGIEASLGCIVRPGECLTVLF